MSHKNSLQFWIFFGKILPQFWIFPSRPHSAELWPRQRKKTGRSAEWKLQLIWVKVYSTVLGGTLKKFRNHFINTKEVWQKSCSAKPASAASSPSACFSFCEPAPSWVKIHLVLPCKYCSSQPSMVHWLSSSIFPCLFGCSSRYGDTGPNLTSLCPRPPKPLHFLKSYHNAYSKMNWEHKNKDKYKDNDKDKDARE